MILGMLFLTLSNADIRFAEKNLVWRSYTAKKARTTTKRVEHIDRKEFAAAAFEEKEKNFCGLPSLFSQNTSISLTSIMRAMRIHHSQRTQMVLLLLNKAPVVVLIKYSNLINVFSPMTVPSQVVLHSPL